MNTTPPTPKEKAKTLLATYAAKKAMLSEATAPFLTQIAGIQEALAKATTLHECELENMEHELKQLALDHGKEIFGDETRSLVESGFILQVRSATSIHCEDEEAAIRELLSLAENTTYGDARVAARACIRTKHELDREAIAKMIVGSPEWFAVFGLVLVEKDSATVKPRPAPKPRKATKPKAKAQAQETTTNNPVLPSGGANQH